MNSIFNPTDNANLRNRLSQLQPDHTPDWGKMNAAQMVLHCQKPLDVAEGKLVLPHLFIGKLFGKMVKNQFLSGKPISKNSPTAKEFKITFNPEFEKEKQLLDDQISRFGSLGPAVIANKKHPFFGLMSDEEWGRLQYVHLDHHLRQFGL